MNKTAHLAIKMGRRPIQWNEVFINFGASMPRQEPNKDVRVISLISLASLHVRPMEVHRRCGESNGIKLAATQRTLNCSS